MADISGSQIPEIWETEEDKKLSIDGLRRYYKEFALKNFRHSPYTNKNTGWKIRVSAQGIGEIRKFRKREHIILVRILEPQPSRKAAKVPLLIPCWKMQSFLKPSRTKKTPQE